MRAGNSNTYGYIDTYIIKSDTDSYGGAVQLVRGAEHAYGFG
jgi:hypothetical protein